MFCLKEVMKDYRSEVQDVLSADRQLANEIEFDLKRFEEQQKELEEQRRKQNTPNNSPQVQPRLILSFNITLLWAKRNTSSTSSPGLFLKKCPTHFLWEKPWGRG